MRYYDANMKSPVTDYDMVAMPTIKGKKGVGKTVLAGADLEGVMKNEMARQLELYSLLLQEGADQQDARNLIGVWYPTTMQTTCTYRALRAMLGDRLSTQAHPFWQQAAKQIKELITAVDKELGDALVDSCVMHGRCVWKSKYDRECDGCVARNWNVKHVHVYENETSFGKETQCKCGQMKPLNLIEKK